MSSLKPILWLSLALPTVPQGLANGYVARKSLPLGRFIKNSLPVRGGRVGRDDVTARSQRKIWIRVGSLEG
eukprot:535894-Amorphochlora_amoeboformis.AAC.1